MNSPEAVGIENPFRNAPVATAPQELMATIGSQREVAEVQASMTVARRFPRNEMEIMDRILQACTRPTLAEGALYEYARGGTDIRGPSIRLAECLAQYWGHLDFGWRVLEERPGATKVQAFAWDLQTGVRSQMVFDVVHERVAQGSKRQLHDPRDIYEHVANAASRRLRACILRVIPGDVVEAAQRQCEVTLKLKVEVTPERVANMVAQFAELGVTKAALEKRVQRRLDTITPGLFVQLGKIFTSLRDGMSLPGDWFDIAPAEASPAAPAGAGGAPAPQPTTNPRQAVREKIAQRKAARADPNAAMHDPKAPPLPPAASTAPSPGPMPSVALQDVVRFARAASNTEDIARVTAIAMELTDEDEAVLAQQHIDAASRRIGGQPS
jgi:hypothetical protein